MAQPDPHLLRPRQRRSRLDGGYPCEEMATVWEVYFARYAEGDNPVDLSSPIAMKLAYVDQLMAALA
jgi:hypothetical protein